MGVSTVMFGTIANLSTGGVPQPLFYLGHGRVDVLLLHQQGFRHVYHQLNIFSKMYFPRLAMPISTMLSGLINFLLQFVMFFCLLLFYVLRGEVAPNWAAMPLLLPHSCCRMGLLGLELRHHKCPMSLPATTRSDGRSSLSVCSCGCTVRRWSTRLSMISNPLLRAVMIANPMTAPMGKASARSASTRAGVSVLMWVISLAWTVLLLGVGISLFGKVDRPFVDTV